MASSSDKNEDGYLYLHADSLDKHLGILELSGKWKFHPGDDTLWAEPNLDDSDWEITNLLLERGLTAKDLIKKEGWYRLHIEIDSSLNGIKLGLAEVYVGSIAIYFDGDIVFSSKYLNHDDNIDGSDILLLPHVTPLTIKRADKHVLSVRYTIHESSFRRAENPPYIFKLFIGEWKSLATLQRNNLKSASGNINLFTGIFSAFALIHLLLYFFYPKAQANLYYAIHTSIMATLTYSQFHIDFSTSAGEFLFYNSLNKMSAVGFFVSGIIFIYTLFDTLAPKWNRPLVYGSAVLIPLSYYMPVNYIYVIGLVFLAEELRMIIYAIIKKISGSWILGVGVILLVIITSFQILAALGVVPTFTDRVYPYGFISLIVSMSFYLARQIAKTNKDLERQVIQVQELSDMTIEQEREKLLLQSENEQKEMKLVEAVKREKVILELEKSHKELREAHEDLKYRIQIEEIITALSTNFINLSAAEIDGAITRALHSIGSFGGVDHSYVFLLSEDGTTLSNSHEWCAEGIEPLSIFQKNLPTENYLWSMKQLERLEVVHIPRVADLPREARELKETLEAQDILSLIDVPMSYGNRLIGFLGFSSVKTEKQWSNEDIRMLILAGETFVNALQRKRAEKELQRAQTQLVQSEKMASLGMLVAGVAHEINTPLGAVTSMHDTLIRGVNKMKAFVTSSSDSKTTSKDNVKKTFDIIDDADKVINSGNARIRQIVKQLKSFARLDEAEFQTVDVNECIEETIKLYKHELKDKVKLKKNFSDLPEIACYPAKLNQVFLNLLVNANQAIDGIGEISINTFTEDDNICIAIMDNGEGIPKKSLDKIFDPGFTTKGVGVGTGLGLSISYRIIQEHKGDISVESKEGKGSTFKITLPIK